MGLGKIVNKLFDIDAESYRLEVARGRVVGSVPFSAYGERESSGAEIADLWQGPTAAQPIPPAEGIQLTLVSTSGNDSAAGTGIQEVEIHYIDASGNEQAEQVELNGLTDVTTVATDIRFIQCIHANRTGSGKTAAGNITAFNGATVYKFLPTGHNRCTAAARMVPIGKNLIISGAVGGASGGNNNTRVISRLLVSSLGNQHISYDTFFEIGATVYQNSGHGFPFDPPIILPELSIVKITIETNNSGYSSMMWNGWLESA